MAKSGCNDSDEKNTTVKSLQVFRSVGSQGGGIEGPPYLYHQLEHRAQAKVYDDYVIKGFRKVPVADQEKLIEELSNLLCQDVLVEKLPDESEEAFSWRCFKELLMKLPSDSHQSFINEFCRRYYSVTEFPMKFPFDSDHSLNRNSSQCSPCNTIGLSVSGLILSGLCEGISQQISQALFNGIVGEVFFDTGFLQGENPGFARS